MRGVLSCVSPDSLSRFVTEWEWDARAVLCTSTRSADSPAGTQWKPTETGTVLAAEQPSTQRRTGSMEKHFAAFGSKATGFSIWTNLRCSLQAIKHEFS